MFALRPSRRTAVRGRTRGFTLIEIMVVVVILGILGAMIVPNIMSRPQQARITTAQADLKAIENALGLYRMDNFSYPSTDQGLAALVERPSGFPEAKNWNPEGYLKRLPEDPWGNPYEYVFLGANEGFELYSLGADGREGGTEGAADIRIEDI